MAAAAVAAVRAGLIGFVMASALALLVLLLLVLLRLRVGLAVMAVQWLARPVLAGDWSWLPGLPSPLWVVGVAAAAAEEEVLFRGFCNGPLVVKLQSASRCRFCTAPGSLDTSLSYAARLRVCSCQAARIASGLRWPFFSISHSAL